MSLLAAQEVDEMAVRRRQARRRAEALLDRLEELRRHIILLGAIPREKLTELARLAQSARAEVDDPQLTAVLEEIDLRAQVEVAKWEAAFGNRRHGSE